MYFKDIELDNYDFMDIGNSVRIYFHPDPHKSGFGFEFKCLTFCSSDAEHEDIWNDSTECEIMCYGTATWDGIRHMWFPSEDDDLAYWYYMQGGPLKNIGEALEFLEELFCTPLDEAIDLKDEFMRIKLKWKL